MSLNRLTVAVFVKTPGLSPIKTRLARDWGEERAHEFYHRSLQAVEAVVLEAARQCPDIHLAWAVAEADGMSDSRWASHARLLQAGDGLGARLDSVYRVVTDSGSAVALIGADAPLMRPDDIITSYRHLQANPQDWVLGRARDGGFYLFAGQRPVDRAAWLAVPYSTDQTADRLVQALDRPGSFFELPVRRDIDTLQDLRELMKEAQPDPHWLSAQHHWWEWVTRTIDSEP